MRVIQRGLRKLDLRCRVRHAVCRRAVGGVGVCLGGAPSQVSADGPGDNDAVVVGDAGPRRVPDGGEDAGSNNVVVWFERGELLSRGEHPGQTHAFDS
jgi:hypothetical protein